MTFEEGIRAEVFLAKDNHPGFERVIDKVVEAQGEFEGWDWPRIAEEFHKAVIRKCVKIPPHKSSKREAN